MLRIPSSVAARRTISAITLVAAAASGTQSCQKLNGLAPAGAAPASGVDIPADYLAAYKAAGSMCAGLSWQILAGIGKVESDHGRSPLPGVHSGQNGWGAKGPMQFISSTWATERARHGDIGPNVYDINAAATAAAHLLCDSGVGSSARSAIYNGYNHDWGYVSHVMAQAAVYGG
jgi:hypothetical protein